MLGIKRNSLSYKTSLAYIVIAISIISLFNFIIWENQSDLIIDNQKLIVESKSLVFRKLLDEYIGSVGSSQVNSEFQKLAEKALDENVSQTVVYSEGGHIIYQWADKKKSDLADNSELVLINRCITRFELENKQFLHKTDVVHNAIHLFLPFKNSESGEIIVVKFSLPMLALTQRKNEVLKICLLITAAIILLQFGMGVFLRKLIIVPISRLVALTNAVAEGDLKQRAHIKQADEIGILSNAYNNMIVNLDIMQAEAKGSNPLSGLPGNLSIMRRIDESLRTGQKTAVIYGDLDNFKAYNDKYGLNKGDEAILHCRDCFLSAVEEVDAQNCFVGHEGGDDFVVVTPFENWEKICQKIVAKFDEGVPRFYNKQHLDQGYIDALDRQGNPVTYPLMSISLAVVSNYYRVATDHRVLIAWAAEMKKVVKKMEGSSYAIDRRTH